MIERNLMSKIKFGFLISIFLVIISGFALNLSPWELNSYTIQELRPVEEKVIFPTITPKKQSEMDLDPGSVTLEVVWQMLAMVDMDRALVDLRRITGEEPICLQAGCFTITNRLTGSQGLDWAQSYLIKILVDLGYTVEERDWASSGFADQNIIARKAGKSLPNEEVYFVSHVDGIALGIDVTPAADDNASSVVNGLELARALSDYEFERTLILFFSSGEEQGYIGVDEYLEALSDEDLSKILYVVNRDMTGYDGNGDRVMELFHGGLSPSILLAQYMGDLVTDYYLDLVPMPVVGCP